MDDTQAHLAPNVIRQTARAAFHSGPFCYVKSIVTADDRATPFCYAYEWKEERYFQWSTQRIARHAAWRLPGCFRHQCGQNRYALS